MAENRIRKVVVIFATHETQVWVDRVGKDKKRPHLYHVKHPGADRITNPLARRVKQLGWAVSPTGDGWSAWEGWRGLAQAEPQDSITGQGGAG